MAPRATPQPLPAHWLRRPSLTGAQRRLEEIARVFGEGGFDQAADMAEEALRAAARASTEELATAARFLVEGPDLMPLFGHTDESISADEVPARVVTVLSELLAPDHSLVVSARDRLAATYAMQGRSAEAARELEWVRGRLARDPAASADALQQVRENLAIHYRNTGQHARAAALYDSVEVCEHLREAKQTVIDGGAAITFAWSPWRDTRTWIYFDTVLDAASLKQLAPADCVRIHSHVGTHDGQEHGLVCDEHEDALMGPHPG